MVTSFSALGDLSNKVQDWRSRSRRACFLATGMRSRGLVEVAVCG